MNAKKIKPFIVKDAQELAQFLGLREADAIKIEKQSSKRQKTRSKKQASKGNCSSP